MYLQADSFFAAIALAILFGSLTLTAQNAGKGFGVAGIQGLNGDKSQPAGVVTSSLPIFSACPIGMRARHESFFQRELVNGSTKRKDYGMQIGLTLTSQHSKRIAEAKVTVRGLNSKGHFLPTDATHSGSSDRTRTMDVAFTTGTDGSVLTDFLLPGFTAVTSIQLDSVTYADGSTWRFSPDGFCNVAPDPFMPIAGR